MKAIPATSLSQNESNYYLYTATSTSPTIHSGNVFYRTNGEEAAKILCQLFAKEYSSDTEKFEFLFKCADDIHLADQILLDEALDLLEGYDDPDPGVYDYPPSKEMLECAEYARRAHSWEMILIARAGDKRFSTGLESSHKKPTNASEESDTEPEPPLPSKADRLNSGLNLFFLLAQAYYKVLESVISTASWCSALDLDLNESYQWIVTSLTNLLANHSDLQSFPTKFEPPFSDLFPSTIRDVDWQDMVAPEVEGFLSAVQKYVREKGMYPPEPSSPAWIFIELFRPSVDKAIERAIAYDRRMRQYLRSLGIDSDPSKIQNLDANINEEKKHRGPMKKAFISYSWDNDDHVDWVKTLATRLRADGVDISIDKWEAVPGDQLAVFMEKAIRENAFVVIICTPRYKQRSNARQGGVGYEGDIMTAEVMTQRNDRKFIPVLRNGIWTEAAPSWLLGKYHVNLTGNPYSERDYVDLVRTLLGIRETAPPVGKPMSTIATSTYKQPDPVRGDTSLDFEDIKITRVIVEDVTQPRNDGTPGSALYSIPFALSRTPPVGWSQIFIESWNHPPRFTTMHRPGIANTYGATVTLNGTTVEEVERYHRDTLQLAISETNKKYREWHNRQEQQRLQENRIREEHQKKIDEASKRIKFD
jgi:hypothetical protein